MPNQPNALFLTVLCLNASISAGDFLMKVTESGYLDTQGFSVILYHSTYDRTFVDQKNTAMEMILHGQRIATNGDVRLLPTPEQWDLVAELKSREADKENNRLSARLSFPAYQMDYRLEVVPEPGGVRVSLHLDKPLPEKLAGRAGFNLEFLPSAYVGKAYLADGGPAGIFPRTPRDPMVKVPPSPDDPKKLPYQEEWDEAKGYTQPLLFATGRSITLAADDPQYRVKVTSETGPLMLFDGRNRAQNGWFVLRTLIPGGKTEGAVVWHIRPDVIPNWTRPPMVARWRSTSLQNRVPSARRLRQAKCWSSPAAARRSRSRTVSGPCSASGALKRPTSAVSSSSRGQPNSSQAARLASISRPSSESWIRMASRDASKIPR